MAGPERTDPVAMIAVLDASDNILAWVDEFSARRFIARGLASLERVTNQRTLRAITDSLDRCSKCGALWKQRHDPSPFDRVAAIERRDLLKKCRASLEPKQRVLLRMRYDGDLTFRQIALALDVSEEAAIQMHRRMIARLQRLLSAMKIRQLREIL
jgi:RNA polymerase sigma factor (sigma-70 family)